jgi:hypothetical protein
MNHLFLLAASLVLLTSCGKSTAPTSPEPVETVASATGVCPPFPLRDADCAVIDPVHGVNDAVPCSPRQTCGASGCHDYEKITEGFHFTQGRGEEMPESWRERFAWTLFPGNYGGNWCYPGGGPMETDRDGLRYDAHMKDPAAGLTSGGENGLGGDYDKARGSETGVIEADCLLCHQPEYDCKNRNAQLVALNFQWAATEGAGFGTVSGKVAEGAAPAVQYDSTTPRPASRRWPGTSGPSGARLRRRWASRLALGSRAPGRVGRAGEPRRPHGPGRRWVRPPSCS